MISLPLTNLRASFLVVKSACKISLSVRFHYLKEGKIAKGKIQYFGNRIRIDSHRVMGECNNEEKNNSNQLLKQLIKISYALVPVDLSLTSLSCFAQMQHTSSRERKMKQKTKSENFTSVLDTGTGNIAAYS